MKRVSVQESDKGQDAAREWVDIFVGYAGPDPKAQAEIRQIQMSEPELRRGTWLSDERLAFLQSALKTLNSNALEAASGISNNNQMIREYREADIEQILDIWLSASIKAHDFVESEFWVSKVSDMRGVYIPASETFVFESDGQIAGFYSLYGNTLAAIFVSPHMQGRGMGSALLDDAKSRRESLQLTVYKENAPSVKFYEKHGFISIGEQIDEHTGHPELIMEYR